MIPSMFRILAPTLLLAGPLCAQERAVLVVDPGDAQSLYVANHYAAARDLPASHVVYLDPDATDYATFAAENLVGFAGDLANRGIEAQVDFVVVPPGGNFFLDASGLISDACFPVNRISIGSAFVTAFSAVVVTVSYHRLRAVKEGMSESQISDVFDRPGIKRLRRD